MFIMSFVSEDTHLGIFNHLKFKVTDTSVFQNLQQIHYCRINSYRATSSCRNSLYWEI